MIQLLTLQFALANVPCSDFRLLPEQDLPPGVCTTFGPVDLRATAIDGSGLLIETGDFQYTIDLLRGITVQTSVEASLPGSDYEGAVFFDSTNKPFGKYKIYVPFYGDNTTNFCIIKIIWYDLLSPFWMEALPETTIGSGICSPPQILHAADGLYLKYEVSGSVTDGSTAEVQEKVRPITMQSDHRIVLGDARESPSPPPPVCPVAGSECTAYTRDWAVVQDAHSPPRLFRRQAGTEKWVPFAEWGRARNQSREPQVYEVERGIVVIEDPVVRGIRLDELPLHVWLGYGEADKLELQPYSAFCEGTPCTQARLWMHLQDGWVGWDSLHGLLPATAYEQHPDPAPLLQDPKKLQQFGDDVVAAIQVGPPDRNRYWYQARRSASGEESAWYLSTDLPLPAIQSRFSLVPSLKSPTTPELDNIESVTMVVQGWAGVWRFPLSQQPMLPVPSWMDRYSVYFVDHDGRKSDSIKIFVISPVAAISLWLGAILAVGAWSALLYGRLYVVREQMDRLQGLLQFHPVGTPMTDLRWFIGGERTIEKIVSALGTRSGSAVWYGERRAGKTSALKHAAAALRNQGCRVIELEVPAGADALKLEEHIRTAAKRAYSLWWLLAKLETIPQWRFWEHAPLPERIAAIQNAQGGKAMPLVILLDEVQNLYQDFPDYPADSPYASMRGRLRAYTQSAGADIRMGFAGTKLKARHDRESTCSDGSILLNVVGTWIYLSPWLSPDEALHLLELGGEVGEIKYRIDESAAAWLKDFVDEQGLTAMQVQMLGQDLALAASRQQEHTGRLLLPLAQSVARRRFMQHAAVAHCPGCGRSEGSLALHCPQCQHREPTSHLGGVEACPRCNHPHPAPIWTCSHCSQTTFLLLKHYQD